MVKVVYIVTDSVPELEEESHSLLVIVIAIPVILTAFIVFSLIREKLRTTRITDYARYRTVEGTPNGHSHGHGPILDSGSEMDLSDDNQPLIENDQDYNDIKKNIY